MAESEKDTRVIDSEPRTNLIQVKPEQVPYIQDISIIDKKHILHVLEIAQKVKKINYSLALALGGDLPSPRKRTNVLLDQVQMNFKYPEKIHILNGFSQPWNTGVDINYLIQNFPNDRWKFYLSMESKSSQQKEKINLFFTELAKRCTEKKVSLLTKLEDHDYDNPDIYTWQPVTMANILKDLYQDSRFSGIWSSVLHPLQRPIPGVSEEHIGLVQEPICGFNGESHSGRMMKLGDTITEQLPKYNNKFGFHVFFSSLSTSWSYANRTMENLTI